MRNSVFILFTFLFLSLYGQDSIAISVEDSIVNFGGGVPEFIGGYDALYKFLDENLVYPEEAIENEYSGIVRVSFIVEVDGSINSIRIVSPTYKELDREVKRVIKLMPYWIPPMNDGVTFRARVQIPISFSRH